MRVSVAVVLLFVFPVLAQLDVDRTCATCSRQKNDSLNLQVRSIRLNQVGYLPQDPHKRAFVANPASQTFTVVKLDPAGPRQVVLTARLESIGSYSGGAMRIRGGYNSITDLYNLSRPSSVEALHRADFSALKDTGTYVLACGKDTSAAFRVNPRIYNQIFETSLQFFGSNRCGKTDSWMHGACHLKDGDHLGAARAGNLTGGWHDCGDHGKYSETVGYAAVVLAMTYAFWPEKGEDFFGKSYHDTLPFGTDGIPDVLYEAKIGADYILKLYKASRQDGLVAQGDMYHSVGKGPGMDHDFWDVPENQDAQAISKGGPARPVTKGIGSNVAGMYAAALAFFAWGWEPFDAAYAKECLQAAADIYDKIVMARRGTNTTMPCCYTGQGRLEDDEALAALGLWFATKDPRFGRDLISDTTRGRNSTAVFEDGWFPAGIMAVGLPGLYPDRPFHHGGWTTDYQQVHSFVLYGLVKLIVGTPSQAAAYGLSAAVADSLKEDAIVALGTGIRDGSQGTPVAGGAIEVKPPYNYLFTNDWGFNRYNMGLVVDLFMYWDLTKSQDHFNIGMDNLNYNLGMNPWDISFVMGAGEKNLQHPHNRAANPEGYNAGGLPYKYQVPKGALMGGCAPDSLLIDNWEEYTNTETCIDFSAQLLIPAQMLAEDLPPDREGPKFRNVNIFPEERSALVTWATDEISRDTVVLLDAPGGKVLQTVAATGLLRNKQVTLAGLTPNTTYYIYFKGADVRGNATEDRNGGAYWPFTTKASAVAAQITDVRVCNETHESALVTWWTRNGEFSSQVDYGKTRQLGLSQSPDDAGIPTRFHRVTLKELDPATLYYFKVLSGGAADSNGGRMYDFRTTEVLVKYTIRIKPTNRQDGGKGTHFYIDVANREQVPYTGIELRFYFTADAAVAGNLRARSDDKHLWGGSGLSEGQPDLDFGPDRKPLPVPGMPGQWYFPITIRSTLPVSGRVSFELVITTAANGGEGVQPFSLFRDAWSVKSHAAPDPVPFEGVDLSKGETGVYTGSKEIEPVNGVPTLTYVETPYITAYYKGVHVYGYGPDYQADPLMVRRVMGLSLTQPVASPDGRLDLRQETGALTLAGTASVSPDGRVDRIMVNGADLPEGQITRAGGQASFTHAVTLVEGTNVFDIIAWDTVHCAVESRKLIVNWRKGPPAPLPQVEPITANHPSGSSGLDSLVVTLKTETDGAGIWYTLDGTKPARNGPGAILYTGPIVIRNQTTVTAIAVKDGWASSPEFVATYNVFPVRVANLRFPVLLDADADGYADAVKAALDTALGAPGAAAMDQAGRARISSGLVPGAPVFTGDTLRLPLAANTLGVRDGKEILTVPPPTDLQDGMLGPGDFPLRDGVAPVLRRALLIKGLPGQPDTLVAAFSEALRGGPLGPAPLAALRLPESLGYAFALGPAAPAVLPSLKEGERAYRFVILSTLGAGGTPAVPQAGDWVSIDPAGSVADTLGNLQANPANAKVPLQLRVSLVHSVTGIGVDGVSRLGPAAQDKPWVVYGGPGLGPMAGENPYALPTLPLLPSGRGGGLAIESTLPFAVTVRVHTTLGQYVGKVRLKITERDFALLEAGATPGSKRLHLLWNGLAENLQPAGTGAYVFLWNLTFFPADEPPRGEAGKAIFGVLRNP